MEVTPCSAGDPPLQLPRYPEHSGLWKISRLALSPTPTFAAGLSKSVAGPKPQFSPTAKWRDHTCPLAPGAMVRTEGDPKCEHAR